LGGLPFAILILAKGGEFFDFSIDQATPLNPRPPVRSTPLFVRRYTLLFFRNVRFLNFLSGLEDLGHLHPISTSGQLPRRIPRRTFLHEA